MNVHELDAMYRALVADVPEAHDIYNKGDSLRLVIRRRDWDAVRATLARGGYRWGTINVGSFGGATWDRVHIEGREEEQQRD